MKKFVILNVIFVALLLPIMGMAETMPSSAVEGFRTSDAGIGLVKMTVGLLFVLALIFASAWFFRRFGNFAMSPNSTVKIVAGISIGHRERVIVIQAGEEQVLVGVTPGRIEALHVLNKPILTENDDTPVSNNFAEKLQAAMKQWKSK